jgi:hypothetical protein
MHLSIFNHICYLDIWIFGTTIYFQSNEYMTLGWKQKSIIRNSFSVRFGFNSSSVHSIRFIFLSLIWVQVDIFFDEKSSNLNSNLHSLIWSNLIYLKSNICWLHQNKCTGINICCRLAPKITTSVPEYILICALIKVHIRTLTNLLTYK